MSTGDTFRHGHVPIEDGPDMTVVLNHSYTVQNPDHGKAVILELIGQGGTLQASVVGVTPNGLRELAGFLARSADELDTLRRRRAEGNNGPPSG